MGADLDVRISRIGFFTEAVHGTTPGDHGGTTICAKCAPRFSGETNGDDNDRCEDSNLKSSRTRRNIMKMGAILGSTAIANIGSLKRGTAEGLHLGDGDGDGGGRYHHDYQCLLRGTMVTTADGSRKIEDLAIGDVLPTVFGGMRPIQWIGHYSVKKSDPSQPWVKAALPVRVARSALARDVPHADLYMTGWHASCRRPACSGLLPDQRHDDQAP